MNFDDYLDGLENTVTLATATGDLRAIASAQKALGDALITRSKMTEREFMRTNAHVPVNEIAAAGRGYTDHLFLRDASSKVAFDNAVLETERTKGGITSWLSEDDNYASYWSRPYSSARGAEAISGYLSQQNLDKPLLTETQYKQWEREVELTISTLQFTSEVEDYLESKEGGEPQTLTQHFASFCKKKEGSWNADYVFGDDEEARLRKLFPKLIKKP